MPCLLSHMLRGLQGRCKSVSDRFVDTKFSAMFRDLAVTGDAGVI